MAQITIEFLKGWVDELGGIWVKGMIMNTLPEFAEKLVATGFAKYVEEPKTVKPASRRLTLEKDEN